MCSLRCRGAGLVLPSFSIWVPGVRYRALSFRRELASLSAAPPARRWSSFRTRGAARRALRAARCARAPPRWTRCLLKHYDMLAANISPRPYAGRSPRLHCRIYAARTHHRATLPFIPPVVAAFMTVHYPRCTWDRNRRTKRARWGGHESGHAWFSRRLRSSFDVLVCSGSVLPPCHSAFSPSARTSLPLLLSSSSFSAGWAYGQNYCAYTACRTAAFACWPTVLLRAVGLTSCVPSTKAPPRAASAARDITAGRARRQATAFEKWREGGYAA